jgi:hypothetical protein
MLLSYYGAGRSGGISRECSIGGRSEHKEGRAWDWMLSKYRPAERAVADQFLAWLLNEGPDGQVAYNARRLGVMYVIWDHHIWSARHASQGWRPYRGPNPHVDHIHISLTWNGAMKQTSFYTGVAADDGQDWDDENWDDDEGEDWDEGEDGDEDEGEDWDDD